MENVSKSDRIRLKYNLGFTLMEIIIAMAIFAIVTGALLGNFFTSLTKGRDSRRKQDLDLVSKSLELYYNDHKAYPLKVSFPAWGTLFWDGTTTYMQKLPEDPKKASGYSYYYDSDATGSLYKLYGCIENTKDSSPNFKSDGYTGTNCGPCISGNLCTYGISSLNTTP